ncbi:MAG: VCBS repeat-containing protein [Candidatus Hydrogenedentes bacterium]|nr:VCBS repeat-containing protein [Candidatus Hydrogenedentota bacterium]
MKSTAIVSISVIASCITSNALAAPSLSWERHKIGTTTYEACSIFDVNNDGNLDLVSGGVWYAGPAFEAPIKICDIEYVSEYYDDFSDYPLDVNGDGYLDIVTGGWFGKTLRWRENPKGGGGLWTTHDIGEVGNIERGCFWDMNGDGVVEAVPNLPGNPFVIFELERDAAGKGTGQFKRYDISPVKQGHGLGYGDVDGDGRGDLVSAQGWLQCPADPFGAEWEWHQEFDFAAASVPIQIYDMNQDGKNDLIVGQGHDYGLSWCEQGSLADGKRTWTKHVIETNLSQFHETHLADLDKDGTLDLVTGKRWRAHNDGDPGAHDPVGLYYYSLATPEPKRVTIDFGVAGQCSGTGIYLWTADVDKNGWLDILAPGKEGLFLFLNKGIISE